ncbi:cbb3-type cytochrome c oxidase subunit II [Fibrella aquatilis]|uniref:Cbb3-type cytochrome c oxidase subunit II n=1 Tax=Fibrella aquatilis TaxID=2817059 RepID=A0A939G2D2_9BACT|nr:cbb3-type cytochrome c oxidase subunit II [Fibrella aquatilis]MBO0929369.1 cbb3-type cytochrome c oxidase subunit II [Fibrella aquatilis]
MWLNLHKNHRLFLGLAAGVFLLLSTLIAVMPAFSVQNNNAPLPDASPTNAEIQNGLDVFVSENCMACHTQQVRNIDMDKTWGGRPGIPADYARNARLDNLRATPSVLGTERTGPDLTELGERQPSEDWHYLHLFNPRSVVKESIMPAYPWLFTTQSTVGSYDKELNVPAEFRQGITGHIVPTERARQLVAYLLSLKQVDLPDGQSPAFLEYKKPKPAAGSGTASGEAVLDGAALYAQHCQACHQAGGEGLKGAFPPLKGSPIVNDANAEMLVRIVLQGYDARAEYAVMPPFAQKLSDAEIAAIATHERSAWSNRAEKVTPELVRQIRAAIETETTQ